MTRVICLIMDGNVDEVLIVNDDEEAMTIEALANENDNQPADERVWIHSTMPINLAQALEYIRSK